MGIKSSLKALSKFEIGLWLLSVITVTLSYIFSADKNWLTLAASLVGVTALIFVAKGLPLGQALTIVFAVFYGIVSFKFHYYGEVLTYLGMSAPAACASLISWLRHPYKDSEVVEVSRMTVRSCIVMLAFTVITTVAFYFILAALETENLIVSTLSVLTSFLASYLTFLRSPYYAVAYAFNDVVLIVLWVLASIEDISYLPMIACFLAFLANDIYGFCNWLKIRRQQTE